MSANELRIELNPGTITQSRENTTVSFRSDRNKKDALGEGGGINVSVVIGKGSKVKLDPEKDYDVIIVERLEQ